MSTLPRLRELADDLGLTEKQRVFAETLAADPERNQRQAAIKAGYPVKSADSAGSRVFSNDKVREYFDFLTKKATQAVERRVARRIMSAAEVAERLTEHAEADIAEFITVLPPPPVLEGNAPHHPGEAAVGPTWSIDIPKAIANGKSHLIKEISYDANGNPKLKVVDQQAALDKLAKYHRLYRDEDDDSKRPASTTLVQILAKIQVGPERLTDIALELLGESTEEK